MWCVHSSLILASKTSSKFSGTGGLVRYFSGWEKYPATHLNCPTGTPSVTMSAAPPAFLENKVQFPLVCWTNKHCVGIGPNRNPFFLNIQVTFFFFFSRTLTLGNACDWFVKLKNYRGIHGGNMIAWETAIAITSGMVLQVKLHIEVSENWQSARMNYEFGV